MKIYLVWEDCGYEGEHLVDVFQREEESYLVCSRLMEKPKYADREYYVEERELK